MKHNSVQKQQRFHIRLIQLLSISTAVYFGINLILHYLILSAQYTKHMNDKSFDMNSYFAFDKSYMLYPISTLKIPIMLMIAFSIGMLIVHHLDTLYAIKYGNKNIKGDDHFLTPTELAKDKSLYSFTYTKIKSARLSGLPIALEDGKMYICPDTTHSLVIGTTRSGKGQTFVLPMIRQIANSKSKHSMVLNDPKGELAEQSYQTLRDNDYNVRILNLRDTNLSSLWNPLQTITAEYCKAMESDGDLSKTTKMIQSLASVFTDNPKSDPIWPDSARALLVAIITYLLERCYITNRLDKVNMYSVYNIFMELGSYDTVKVVNGAKKNINALDELFQNLPIGDPAKSSYASSNFAKGEMRASIFSTLATNIGIFGSDMGISKLTSENQIDFADLINPKKPCAIFMVLPDEDPSRNIIASLFVNQCYNQLVELSSQFKKQQLPQRVHFILDEFGNMIRIPAMDTKITVGAGRNLLFNLFVQDLNQLDSKYDNAAKTIRSNCGNIVYINSLDNDTNEYMSKIIGNETIMYDTYSGQINDFVKNKNMSVESRPLMSATQLGKMEFGEAVIKQQRKNPIHTKFEPFYKLGIPDTSINQIPIEKVIIDLSQIMYPVTELLDAFKNGEVLETPKMPTSHVQESASAVTSQSTHGKAFTTSSSTEMLAQLNEAISKVTVQNTTDEQPKPEEQVPQTQLEKAMTKITKEKGFTESFDAEDYETCDGIIQKAYRLRRITEDEKEVLIAHLSQKYDQ